MKTRTIWSTLATVALVSASLLAAAPATATPGLCQSKPIVTSTATTIYVKNICGNLAGRYLIRVGIPGTSWTVTVAPLATYTFPKPTPNSWQVSIIR